MTVVSKVVIGIITACEVFLDIDYPTTMNVFTLCTQNALLY